MAKEEFSLDFFSLKGKVAIVTGANTGLGMCYAKNLAKAGADLFIPHFIPDVTEVKKLVEAEGRRVEFLQGDLSDKDYIHRVIDTCLEKYGKIDILVNNAGANCFAPFDEFPDEQYEKVIKVNLNACYFLAHEVGKIMKKQGGGKIINIGSALSFTADANCPPYIIAKHGVIGLTRWLCNELGAFNVQANALCPGFLATDMNKGQRDMNPEFYNHIKDRIPAGDWGDPEVLAGTLIYLASRASDYVNGWYISVDGGFTTKL